MDKYTKFTLVTANNLSFSNYLEKISRAFKENVKLSKYLFGKKETANGDLIVLNYHCLSETFFLDVDFILGKYREYLKLDCKVFASTKEELTEIKNKLEIICEAQK